MAIEVTKVYREHFPALRFIGKRYTNDDRDEAGGFGNQWGEWWANDRFDAMKVAVSAMPFDEATIGLMTMRGDMTGFTYWVGLFFPADTDVPEGYDSLDLPESDIGVGWVRGREENGEIYGDAHGVVCKRLEETCSVRFRSDVGGDAYCFFERYVCPRFTEKDENGNVTLDYGNYILGEEKNRQPPEKLTDARAVRLPPMTVASNHIPGCDEPEQKAGDAINRFVRDTRLWERMPDIRQFGFNHPNPVDETNAHGYEIWVAIPDDMEVPAPLVKKRFPGGLYAAHTMSMANFEEWDWIIRWVNESERYKFAGDWKDQEHMSGLLEETVGYGDRIRESGNHNQIVTHLHLLVPIRERTGAE